jgi:hypothetical protein
MLVLSKVKMKKSNLIKTLGLVLFLSGCSPNETQIEKYEGVLPTYGNTKISIYSSKTTPKKIIDIESDFLNEPEYPFQRHSLVDQDGDGQFDEAYYPYTPKGTNIVMSRIFHRESGNKEFFDLENVVNGVLKEKGLQGK